MIPDSLFFSNRQWLLPSIGIAAFLLVLLLWSYSRSRRWALGFGSISIKLLGVAALVFCLLEPLFTRETARPGANLFLQIADNSKGMRIKDRGQTQSRGEQLRAALLDGSWQKELADNFQVRRYSFDSRLQTSSDFSELQFDGSATSLNAALQKIASRYQGQPLAGILLFTDGNATDLGDQSLDLTGLPPIYPVVSGSDEAIRDVSLTRVFTSQTLFEDAPVTIQTEVCATGFREKPIVAELLDQSGLEVDRQTQIARSEDDSLLFRFQTRPSKTGICFYQLRVVPEAELNLAHPTDSSEATLANNSRIIPVDRPRGAYRMLYVSGRPNWEFKFLNRALAGDDQIQMSALIRIANREPKFDFRSSASGSAHPLFEGLQNADEVERYDQPVLVRLNTKDALELAGGFPKSEDDLFAYDALIFDDLESEFFTQDQMALIKRFVSERGGALLMLGGAESFHQGKFDRTPIGDLLPVYLDGVTQNTSPGELQLTLTREGWLQPWARLRKTETEERARLDGMPKFEILNQVRQIKPGASVIATVHNARGENFPALVAQRFGQGRVAAMLLGDVWHWGLRDEESHHDMDKAWRQLARWLIADGPKRIEFSAEEISEDSGEAMSLKVRVRDQRFHPLDNASVNIAVRRLGNFSGQTNQPFATAQNTNAIHLIATADASEAGLYTASCAARDTGAYLAEAVIRDANGGEIGRAQTGWACDPDAREFATLKPNRALLSEIARKTGGEIVSANDLADFTKNLPSRKAPIHEIKTWPAWHQPWLFAFALGCFVVEWGLRRWKGLP